MRTTYQFRVWHHPDKRYLVSYGNKGELFEFANNWVDIGWFIQCQRCESPQRFTVQQYTGLRDKNGRPIFEGDTVNFTASPLNAPEHENQYYDFEVYYSETLASFVLGRDEWNFCINTGIDPQSLEVTGHIPQCDIG
jgi:uncharacterized phage protein (TIGR01671 family)